MASGNLTVPKMIACGIEFCNFSSSEEENIIQYGVTFPCTRPTVLVTVEAWNPSKYSCSVAGITNTQFNLRGYTTVAGVQSQRVYWMAIENNT